MVTTRTLAERFEKYLESDEEIVWSGQPDPQISTRREEVGEFVVMGICYLAVLAMPIVIGTMIVGIVGLVMSSLVVMSIGFGVVCAALATERSARQCIVYAITNKRILELWTTPWADNNCALLRENGASLRESRLLTMAAGPAREKLMSLRLEEICQTQLTGNSDGSGSLQFTSHGSKCHSPLGPYGVMFAADPRHRKYPVFVLVADVAHVEEVLRRLPLPFAS